MDIARLIDDAAVKNDRSRAAEVIHRLRDTIAPTKGTKRRSMESV